MANSTQSVVSDGGLVLLDISFDYLDRSSITVYFDSVLTEDWAWVGVSDKQITFDPAVPVGTVVLVKRTTDLAELRHSFTLGAAFTAQSLDEDLTQVLHIAQEATEANFGGDFYGDINLHFNRITNVSDPVGSQDVATKAFCETGMTSQLTMAQSYALQALGYAASASSNAASALSSKNAAAISATSAGGFADSANTSAINAAAAATDAIAAEANISTAIVTERSAVATLSNKTLSGTTVDGALLVGPVGSATYAQLDIVHTGSTKTRGMTFSGDVAVAGWTGFVMSPNFNSVATLGTINGYNTYMMSAAGTPVDSLRHFAASNSAAEWFGAAPATEYGVFIPQLGIGTTVYGVYTNITNAAGKWNVYANGGAPNYFNGDLRTNSVLMSSRTVVATNTDTTVTIASLKSGIRTCTPTANMSITLPTGALSDASFSSLQNNQSFEWSIINLDAATYTVAVVANTGHTVVGNMVVQPGTSGRFLTRKSAADTFVTYRVA